MRIKLPMFGLAKGGNLADSNGLLTGRIYLGEEGANGLSAVTKSYVDTALATFSATQLAGGSGALPAQFLPAFTGAASCASGDVTNFVLDIPGTEGGGTYTKFHTDGEGRLEFGDYLTATDIPDVAYSVVSEKPATVAEYGITDSLSLTGGSVPSNFLLAVQPSGDNHIATKTYADAQLAAQPGGFETGTIVAKSELVDGSYADFLRCNGSIVSKTTYPNLSAIVGGAFDYVVTVGNGRPWQNQYVTNTEQSANISGWVTETALPASVSLSQVIVTRSRVYLLGGIIGGVESSTIYTANIGLDGTIGAWSAHTSSLPVALSNSQAVVVKNRAYLLGGYSGAGSATVYSAPISSDGVLGAWSATGNSLPGTLFRSQATVIGKRVYMFGGGLNGPANTANIYTATIDSSGILGAWSLYGVPLTAATRYTHVAVVKNRLYVFGGFENGSVSASVRSANISPDGTFGTWTTETSMPYAVQSGQVVVTRDRLYLLGGSGPSVPSGSVLTAAINTDGSLGEWTAGAPMPGSAAWSQSLITKNRIYNLGGDGLGTVYSASIQGGSNDYSDQYGDTDYTTLTSDQFRLPDISDPSLPDVTFYIKT